MVLQNYKKQIFVVLFLVLIGIISYMLLPYVSGLVVGALIAYFIYPLYQKILLKIKKPVLAQALLSFLSIILILSLVTLIGIPLVSQSKTTYTKLDQYISSYNQEECNNYFCPIVEYFDSFFKSDDFFPKVKNALQTSASSLIKGISSAISGVVSFLVFLTIVVFSLFYFLDNGKIIREEIVNILPVDKRYTKKMINRFTQTLDAVVQGNISTALLQGLSGGIIFWVLGIPASLFWGLVMTFFAFIPAVGPAVIWIPAVIFLFVQGSFVKGIILLLFCLIVLGYIDNVLKPKWIGEKINLSSFSIFLGVLGGLQLFGILGLFFGPILIALLITFVDIYKEINSS